MGSFKITCSLSRLPVSADMSVRAFILAWPQIAVDDLMFAPNAVFTPLTTAIRGSYDDAGRLKNAKINSTTSGILKQGLSGLEPCKDISEFLDTGITDSAERITIRHGGQDIRCKTALAVVREDVYQAAIALLPTPGIDAEEIKKSLQVIKDLHTQYNALSAVQPAFAVATMKDSGTALQTLSDHRFGYLSPLLFPDGTSLMHAGLRPLRARLFEKLDREDVISKGTVDFAVEIAELMRFNHALSLLNALWQPATRITGYDGKLEILSGFARSVETIAQKEIAEIKAESDRLEKPFNKAVRKKKPLKKKEPAKTQKRKP